MKLKHASGMLGLAAMAVIASPFASADDIGWYGGANVGQSRAKIDDARITSGLSAQGISTNSITDDDRDTAYKIFGGYQFNRNFALEGGYFDLGKFGYAATTTPTGTLNGNSRVKGLNLDLVGLLPITGRLSAFGRAGVAYADVRDSFSGTGATSMSNSNPHKRDANYKLGVGLQYAFTDALAMRAEVERYRINDAVGNRGDIDLVSVGLIYRFGAKSPTPVAHAEAPAIIAPAPAPVPVAVAAPPPPPALKKVTFSADSLFDFDNASMKPAGKLAVDRFAADLRGTDFSVVRVTGYTDRIGSHAYNVKLAMRRAEAVKAYLVESAGIAADKIGTVGAGEADPVTKPDECKGSRKTKALIACLQADRRVEIEVSGTR
jgi:OmpA-OmpF porin, OOP family